MSLVEPHAVPMPMGSRITEVYARPDLADAFAIDVPPCTARDPETLARFIFSCMPRWVTLLMAVRDALVSIIGLKTGRSLRASDRQGDRVGIFKLYEARPREVILGEDDRHLDFRVSVLHREPDASGLAPMVILSTVVKCHNAKGRFYLRLIAPFHRRVVQSLLRHGARCGWPADEAMPGARTTASSIFR